MKKASEDFSEAFLFRAENEARTRDPNLGKVVLYQLSYFRIVHFIGARDGNRTRTGIAAHGILSPACLPIPPPEPMNGLQK